MEKLFQSYDLSEIEDIVKKAKEAYNKGDYESAMRFLDEAVIALEGAKKVTPLILSVTWTEEEYMEYFIQNHIDRILPPLTKEQIQFVINDEDMKPRSLKLFNNVTNSITQLERDLNTHHDINIIYSDYNRFRSSVITEYQLVQEIRRKFEPVFDAFIQKYIEFDVYDKCKGKKDNAVDDVRKNIKKVYLSLGGWLSTKQSWEDFKNSYLVYVDEITDRYKQDYINIVGEPPVWYKNQIEDYEKVPVDDRVWLAESCAERVKHISPDTFVVIYNYPVHHKINEEYVYTLMWRENEIDAFCLDDYSLRSFVSVVEFSTRPEFWNKDKELWIGQTGNSMDGHYCDNLPDKCIVASIDYAQNKGLEGYCLYFGNRLHTKDFKPTPAFFTYKKIIEEVCNNTINAKVNAYGEVL
jgi:hypothetical protein